MSTPSMTKLPPSSSVSLRSVEMREDFPAPVLPTMPTLSPPTRVFCDNWTQFQVSSHLCSHWPPWGPGAAQVCIWSSHFWAVFHPSGASQGQVCGTQQWPEPPVSGWCTRNFWTVSWWKLWGWPWDSSQKGQRLQFERHWPWPIRLQLEEHVPEIFINVIIDLESGVLWQPWKQHRRRQLQWL